MKRLLFLFALLSVSLSVQATKPDIYTFEFPDLAPVADCGEFSVWDNAWLVLKFQDFYNTKGDLIRTQIHATAFDDLYRCVPVFDPDLEEWICDAEPDGIHLTGTAHANIRDFFNDSGEYLLTQQAGLAVGIIVPGYGPLFLDAGRLVWNDTGDLIFSAGNNHDWNFGDFEALCNYFDQD